MVTGILGGGNTQGIWLIYPSPVKMLDLSFWWWRGEPTSWVLHPKRNMFLLRNPWRTIILREPQHTPGAYPRHPQTPKWKEFLHKLLVGGLGYAPGVCWKVLRIMTGWRIPIFYRKYWHGKCIFKWWVFHCHVCFFWGVTPVLIFEARDF